MSLIKSAEHSSSFRPSGPVLERSFPWSGTGRASKKHRFCCVYSRTAPASKTAKSASTIFCERLLRVTSASAQSADKDCIRTVKTVFCSP